MRRVLTAIAACLALAIAGCGSGDTSSTEAPTSASTATAKPDRPIQPRGKPTVTVPSGPPPRRLVKKDLIEGRGPPAKAGDEVGIQYVGVLYATGKQFAASSGSRDAPVVFTLGDPGVTVGWNRGIEGMKLGGRREVIIPPRFGYGSERVGSVPSNSTLVYVIELVDVD